MDGMRIASVIIGSMMMSMDGRCWSKNSCTDGARASSEHAFQLYTVKGEGMDGEGTSEACE